ncbi:ParB/RepB/Spo0J family partition protein [Streptomyces noursei]|uniref:ParB/RepB/Spo0J family partition protein n=1 Tax=Streptomyces noursei TaxID=1971 RepID=UPI0021A8A3DC|nr:ParB/RepB/Spo0J family partition protein [Streptomyces noursei]UWS69865.1 ParB/RepB/Spo0J family partition protein [Streptomyces noursei]UWS76916.1 ParB/RepB/Spo0J family partition protein [Streptomyces noursei]
MTEDASVKRSRTSSLLDSNVESVSVASLVATGSPRLAGEDAEHAHTLSQSEAQLPPIIVHRSSMRIIDGMHRLRAAILRGRDEIDVQFFDGSEKDAFVLAVESNVQHGLPLTLSDRTAAAGRIVKSHPEWSDRAVAAATGLAAKTVAAIRRRSATEEVPQLHTRIGRDGKARPVNSAEGRRLASTLLMEKPDASLREVAKAAGISTGTVRDVRQRLQRNENPVPPRQRRAELNAAQEVEIPATMDGGTSTAIGALDQKTATQALTRDPQLRMSEESPVTPVRHTRRRQTAAAATHRMDSQPLAAHGYGTRLLLFARLVPVRQTTGGTRRAKGSRQRASLRRCRLTRDGPRTNLNMVDGAHSRA